MSLAALQRFAAKRAPEERCEFCSEALALDHAHLVEPRVRKLLCACDACALLLSAAGDKYRRVPRSGGALENFQMSDALWERFEIPIGVAYFFKSSPMDKIVALYPSPAGAVETLLPLQAWDELAVQNPVLAQFEPDVEALLVNRLKNTREYFRLPIDQCYRLTGLFRLHWRGFTGGDDVWRELENFFSQLRAGGHSGR